MNMSGSLTSESGCGGKQGFLRRIKPKGSGRDKLIAVPVEHNPSERICPKGECLSPCSALDRTSKDDPTRSGLAVRASLCAGGHNESSDVRGRNDPQAFREEGINRNPPPLGVGRFNGDWEPAKLRDWLNWRIFVVELISLVTWSTIVLKVLGVVTIGLLTICGYSLGAILLLSLVIAIEDSLK
jgi:hypothetical protein